MDVYERKARVYPAIVSMVIPTFFAIYLFWSDLKDVQNVKEIIFFILKGIISPALGFGAMGFFFRNLFRWISKQLFQFPFVKRNEMYMPTTNYLLWNDPFYDQEKKTRIYTKLRQKYNIHINPSKFKKSEELDIRKKIAGAVASIRKEYMDFPKDKRIVDDYNIQVGFFRNYLGGAIFSFILIFILTALNLFFSFSQEYYSSIIAILSQTLFFALSVLALKSYAKDYAKNLIDFFDTNM